MINYSSWIKIIPPSPLTTHLIGVVQKVLMKALVLVSSFVGVRKLTPTYVMALIFSIFFCTKTVFAETFN